MWTLVTGGAKRLGADLCVALADAGFSVVVHYNHSQEEALEVVAKCQEKGVQSAAIQGDFSSWAKLKDFMQRYLQQFPHTHALINNVGNFLTQSAQQTSVEEWEFLFQTNLHAPFFLSQSLLPTLIQFQGQIINIGVSGLYKQTGHSYAMAYALTKAALLEMTRSLARELAPQGVRVNMVSPGMLDISVDLPTDIAQLPMHRPGYCREVSRVVTFLLDSASAYITGQNIEVAGGWGLA